MSGQARIGKSILTDERGSVSIEASFLTTIMIVMTLGAVESAYMFWQWNGGLQAARQAARIASLSDPVDSSLTSMTGIQNGVSAGDPMPAYTRTCDGQAKSCSPGGTFSASALNRIVYGSETDLSCAAAEAHMRGACDILKTIKPANISVSYENSGLGTAGDPADLVPLISVKLTGLSFKLAVLDAFVPANLKTMPDIEVVTIAEDMDSAY